MTRPAGAGPARIPPDLRATLVLVRHGELTFVAEGRFQGRQDPPLSPLGERQASLAAAWLAAVGGPPGLGLAGLPVEIVHSPLIRAARSAALIAAAMSSGAEAPKPRLRAEVSLAEISQGEWEGLTHDEVAARWGEQLAAWRQRPAEASAPSGERLTEADQRVRATVPGLLAPLQAAGPTPRGAWSIVVAHDGVLRVLLLALLDLPLDRFWAFPFALGGLSVVELDAGRAMLRAHNLATHVADPADPAAGGASMPDRRGAL